MILSIIISFLRLFHKIAGRPFVLPSLPLEWDLKVINQLHNFQRLTVFIQLKIQIIRIRFKFK